MKFTNKYNLPVPVYNAIANSEYTKGGADFSVTELAMSPQERRLGVLHYDELEKDAMQNIWALLGTAVHYILQKASDTSDAKRAEFAERQLRDIREIVDNVSIEADNAMSDIEDIINREGAILNPHLQIEDRLSIKVAGYVISGQADLYDRRKMDITDYKVTGTYSYTKHVKGDSETWMNQLNVYRHIFVHHNRPVQSLNIFAIFKDWKGYEVKRQAIYPDVPALTIPIEVKKDFDVLQYILDRIKLHVKAMDISDEAELAKEMPCTDKERWATKKYAVMKKGGKNASKVFEDDDAYKEANVYLASRPTDDYFIEDRSKYGKCEEYCDVARFCKQWNRSAPVENPITEAPDVILKVEDVETKNPATPILDDIEEAITEPVAKKSVAEIMAERKAKIQSVKTKPTEDKPEVTEEPKPIVFEEPNVDQNEVDLMLKGLKL